MQDAKHLILYDGVCGLCNGLVRFVLPRDRKDRFRFAPLQGDLARETLRRYGRDPGKLDTVYVLEGFAGRAPRLLDRDRASIFVLERLGFPWMLAWTLHVVPGFLRRPVYNFIARRRYGWFGTYGECPIPAPEYRHKFL